MTESIPSPHEHIVFTEFDDTEGVLVDLNSKRYYTLNETAMIIWRGLERKRTREEIIRDITDAYDVTQEHAAESFDKLVASLRARQLLTPEGQ
ncbi:MAG TPA: PqqD family protein [Pyrinomonadaceae bacterium]|nr:PqqD family protein [Pyrinomonadaceae bacterium]